MVEVTKVPSRKKKTEENTVVADALKDAKVQADTIETSEKTTSEATVETPVVEEVPREPKVDAQGRAYGTGRRKNSTARVFLKPGKGQVVINGKPQQEYFRRQTQLLVLNQPFLLADRVNQYDVMCTVKGGGLSGQAGAVRHGIARALDNIDPTIHTTLKVAGLLTRDSRMVERKKVGLHKARRSKQWAKR